MFLLKEISKILNVESQTWIYYVGEYLNISISQR